MKLTICSFNLENFFINIDRNNLVDINNISNLEWEKLAISNGEYKNKPLHKLLQIRDFIIETDADIYCFQEVMGKESLRIFVNKFLNDEYNYHVHESNSNRNIFVGFIAKKQINTNFIDFSNMKMENGLKSSRNISCLQVLDKNNMSILSLLGVHLKSKRVESVQNQPSFDTRLQESNLYKKIANDLRKNSQNVILLGDFNAQIKEEELQHLQEEYINFNDINNSYLGTFGTKYLDQKIQQIDYILVHKNDFHQVDINKSYIHRFKNEYGDLVSLPFEKIEKEWLPSDHLPIILTLNIEGDL